MMNDKKLVQDLLVTHLGPIERLDRETETALIEAILQVEYPNGKNISAALTAAGVDVTRRQLKPYKDALIMARMGDSKPDVEFIRARARIDFHPGTKVALYEM